MADSPELLFFDTFSHEPSEELNLDLVQFPKPVYVSEVRIIPLGARVQGDFPGGVRLGATNPSQFQIDFFVNDLSKPSACTFETLGTLDYCQNGRIHMDCEGSSDKPRQIPTDGLVLKGWYTTITLAVYGTVTKSIIEQVNVGAGNVSESIPPPAPVSTPPTTSNAAPWNDLASSDVYPASSYSQDSYEQSNYPPEYYSQDAPKDPRAYHHSMEGGNVWDGRDEKDRRDRDISRERDINHPREKDRTRHNSVSHDGISLRSRSPERARSRGELSPRYSRSRSRDRDYAAVRSGRDDGFRRDSSRSPGYRERDRSLSRDKDWDRSYKRDDYRSERRHRQSSYERSRGSSYEKKRGSSYEKRAPSYECRPSSYEKRDSSYEKHGSSYEKRLSPYEKRSSSYEKRVYDKRAPSYDRMRELSYDSRSHSPLREDPRKRPRTPPVEITRRPHTPIEMGTRDRDDVSPGDSVVSDEGALEYDHNSKSIQSKDDIYSKSFKGRKASSKNDVDKLHPANKEPTNYDTQHSALLSVNIIEGQSSPNQKVNTPLSSPCATQEDNHSMDNEQFEPILSDEDICDDSFAEMDYDMNEYCVVDDMLKCFNPFRADWQQYIFCKKSPLFLPFGDKDDSKNILNITFDELCFFNTNFQKLFKFASDYEKVENKYSVSNFISLTAEFKEEWVEICEQLPVLINNISKESDILYRIFNTSEVKENDNCKMIMHFLLNFCRIGLDYELALSQNQATFKIRHIKCGIRLIEALSSHKYNSLVITSFFNYNIDVYTKLLELYCKDHMALSIKLMILKALDSCLGSEITVENFLSKQFVDILEKSRELEEKVKVDKPVTHNGYQILLIMLAKNPLSRVKFAINSLINKINIYELLKELHRSVLKLNNKGKNGQAISESEIEFIINSLEEILHIYHTGSFELSQPRRFLPVSAQFDINKSCVNNVLIDLFQTHKLIEICLYLLACPLTYNYSVISNPIYELILHLISSYEGLLYLTENIKTCDLLFRTLMQPYTQQPEEDQMMAVQDFNNCTSLQQLGLELSYKLQTMYYIDSIFHLQSFDGVNESEFFDKLHGLFCLGLTNIGKISLANVLSMGDNIQCLLNIYEKDIHVKTLEKDESRDKTKSPTKNYAVDLTVLTIQFSSDVNFLKKYGRRILNIAKKFDIYEQSMASSLQEILPYLKPLEKSNVFLNDDISGLVDILKVSAEHVTSAPGDLITSLRILKHLGIPELESKKSSISEKVQTEYTELKYKYAIIQLYSLDGVSHLITILEKLCNYFEQPSLHTATFVSVHGLQIIHVLLPTLELLSKMLTYVIQCRNTQFKDLTSISVILQAYNLAHSYPVSSAGYKMAQKACKECIEILLAYTQPIAEDPAENESIHKSLWTLLCGEIFKYIHTAPYTFVPGLLVFSEVLPLPLPIQTKYPLSDAELSDMVSNRKLWSAHLHTLSTTISEMIQTICLSVCQPLVQLLKRVCNQLADLASNMALCVTRAVLDLLLIHICGDNNSVPQPLTPLNFEAARILNFLACLSTHPSIKCTILHLIRQSNVVSKSEDRYSLFIPLICSILTTNSDSQAHIQSQECVVSIISNFYDSEITLLTQFDSVPPIKTEIQEDTSENIKLVMTPEIYLTNAVPTKDTLLSLINASLECMSNENTLPSLTLSLLRTFFLLTEHDYGFYYFKFCVDKNKQVFPQLFAKLINSVNKDSPECISTFLELLKILQSTAEDLEATEGLQFVPRTSTLSIGDISDMIGWSKNKEHHPILMLEKYLKDINADEELLSHIRQLVVTLSSSVNSANIEPLVVPIPPVLGVPEHLITQFNGRCLWTQGDAQDERLSSTYWLGIAMPQVEEDAVEVDMVSCDLSELTQNYLPVGTDLVVEAERLLHLPPAAPRVPTEPPLFRTKRLHVSRDKRPYVSPARGRGISQHINLGSSVAAGAIRTQVDAFRSRPPNTSRPPSLHVDDFLALEGCGAQPTGPTGYNKLSVVSSRGGRGLRTRGITITDRGRFASATPTNSSVYSRRGRGMWTTNSTTNTSGSENSPSLSGHFGRVSSTQHYQSPLAQHTTNTTGWTGTNRGSRRGRGLRHGRASFLR